MTWKVKRFSKIRKLPPIPDVKIPELPKKMIEQELTRLLAFAGFVWHSYKVFEYEHKVTQIEDPYWSNPKGQECTRYPDFLHDLNACFRWLVPPTIDRIMAEQGCSSDLAYAILFKRWLQELELIIPRAAEALCQAILKMLDLSLTKSKEVQDE